MLTPDRIPPPGQGLRFRRSDGHCFRPLYVDQSGLRLQWQREYSAFLARSPLAEFMADVDFDLRDDHSVIFTKMEGGREVLSRTTGIERGARMPRASFQKLKDAEQSLKAMIGKGVLSEDEEAFAAAFSLPDPRSFPAAYRVRRAGLFSRRKLFVLWGMMPEFPRNDPVISIDLGSSAASSIRNSVESSEALTSSDLALGLRSESESQVVYDDSLGWPKWLEWLVVILSISFVLFILSLLFSLISPGCEKEHENVAQVRTAPSDESQQRELEKKIVELKKDFSGRQPGVSDEKNPAKRRLYALEYALSARRKAEAEQLAARTAERAAKDAEQNANESGRPEDAAKADMLRKEAEVQKAGALKDDEIADNAYMYPQESLRTEELAQNERLKELSRQAEDADKAAQASGRTEDVARSARLQKEAEALRRNNPVLPISPDEEREARNRLYVAPKNSTQDGEIIVRRFKDDELVAKKGIKLHLEADANGRKDFKVKGWAFGLAPMIKTERLEDTVPVGPDLSIETPLDLYFEYRGADGQMHEDCAPFVISGDIEFRLSLEIEHAKEVPAEAPVPKAVPGA